jgi:hypothetical protein
MRFDLADEFSLLARPVGNCNHRGRDSDGWILAELTVKGEIAFMRRR